MYKIQPMLSTYRVVYILVYIWKNIQQGQILEGFDPQVPGFGVKTTYNEEKYQSVSKPIKDRRNRAKQWVLWDKIVQPKILSFLEKS